MNHPRHSEPLPLGTPEQPYSKGLMARALVAVGVPLGRAYELAKRIDDSFQLKQSCFSGRSHTFEGVVDQLGQVDALHV